MTARIIIDTESTSLRERPALIRSPRRNRQRYPAACVEPQTSVEAALAGANPRHNVHPAIVYGPSVSSESQHIYYLVRWLD